MRNVIALPQALPDRITYAGSGSRGHYLRNAAGLRTRLYVTLEAAERALARGEIYTDDDYRELTRIHISAVLM